MREMRDNQDGMGLGGRGATRGGWDEGESREQEEQGLGEQKKYGEQRTGDWQGGVGDTWYGEMAW